MDLGGRRGMKHMLDYLVAHPEKGLLAYEMGIPTIVQYWRSFEQLEAFAKDKDDPHLDVWRQYWRRVGRTGRTVSGTRRTWSRRDSTRPSTGTCLRTASARRGGSRPWRNLQPPAVGSAQKRDRLDRRRHVRRAGARGERRWRRGRLDVGRGVGPGGRRRARRRSLQACLEALRAPRVPAGSAPARKPG